MGTTAVRIKLEARLLACRKISQSPNSTCTGLTCGTIRRPKSCPALPVTRWVEYLTPSPYIEDIVATPFTLDADGMLPIPTGPGLGIEMNPEGIERLSRSHIS